MYGDFGSIHVAASAYFVPIACSGMTDHCTLYLWYKVGVGATILNLLLMSSHSDLVAFRLQYSKTNIAIRRRLHSVKAIS
jgi:hypothetical protein